MAGRSGLLQAQGRTPVWAFSKQGLRLADIHHMHSTITLNFVSIVNKSCRYNKTNKNVFDFGFSNTSMI